jgi:hypothetical protein
MFGLFTSAAAESLAEVVVALDPTSHSVVLGEAFTVQVTVTNEGDQATLPLVLHVDITDPEKSTSVDPEDWTSTLSKAIGIVDSGSSLTVDWELQPISGGDFAVYAVVLSGGAETLSASNVLTVAVQDQRSLNPGGILPVAIGAPAVVGSLLALQIWFARRPSKAHASARTG